MEKNEKPLFIKERMREIHGSLVEKGIRDQITLIASGGIAMAEHMAKVIICGADALAVDIPLLVAMECRVCRRCKDGIDCPIELESIDPAWGTVAGSNPLPRGTTSFWKFWSHGYAGSPQAQGRDGPSHVF